ncbi:MAG: hypothetical protein PHX08_20300 [Lachnospiraceae bacterium]|nr:hypothetical protein [Lachnospiraceae bacterium]
MNEDKEKKNIILDELFSLEVIGKLNHFDKKLRRNTRWFFISSAGVAILYLTGGILLQFPIVLNIAGMAISLAIVNRLFKNREEKIINDLIEYCESQI